MVTISQMPQLKRGFATPPGPAASNSLRTPNLLLDVAHNPAGAWTLRAAIAQLPESRPRTLLFSCLRDKSLPEMARSSFPLFDSAPTARPRAPTTTSSSPPSTAPAQPRVESLLAAAHRSPSPPMPLRTSPEPSRRPAKSLHRRPHPRHRLHLPHRRPPPTGARAISFERPAISFERSAISPERSAISPERSAMSQQNQIQEPAATPHETPDAQPANKPRHPLAHLPIVAPARCPGDRRLRLRLPHLRPVGQLRPPAARHRPHLGPYPAPNQPLPRRAGRCR